MFVALFTFGATNSWALSIYVADAGRNEVRRYDGGALVGSFSVQTPTDVVVGPNGDLFVASQTRLQPDHAEIVRINPTTGEQSVFATRGINGIFSVTLNGDVPQPVDLTS